MFHFLTAPAPAAGGMGSMLIMLVLMFGVLYFFMIRPENKRKKEAEAMRNAMKVGDEITTIGGITGTVCAITDDKFVIETSADRVRVEFAKWALSTNDTATKDAKARAEKEAKAREQAKADKKAAKGKK